MTEGAGVASKPLASGTNVARKVAQKNEEFPALARGSATATTLARAAG